MLARQRQELILDAVRTTGGVRVSELVDTLGVSDMTVRRGIEVLATRGLVTRVTHAVAALRRLHVDWLLMGVHGMDAEAGSTTPNLVEAEPNRALVASARRVAVVADNSKWGVVGLSTIAALDEVDVVVTDDGLEPEARRVLDSSCGRLVLAA